MIAELLLYFSLAFLITGVLSPFVTNNNKIVNYVAHGMAALGCLATVLCAVFIFVGGKVDLITPWNMPGGPVHIRREIHGLFGLVPLGHPDLRLLMLHETGHNHNL